MSVATPAGHSKKKRSRMVIDREVQYGVIRKIMLHWCAFFVCNFICLTIWVMLFERPEAGLGETLRQTFQKFSPVFVISLVLMPVFLLDTLKLTNRFAGPISRLRTEMQNAGAGRPVRRLKFRSNDYWFEIADDFNNLAEKAGVILAAEDSERSKTL